MAATILPTSGTMFGTSRFWTGAVIILSFGKSVVLPVNCLWGSGLRCYQCGQYTDGVGSITPCINYTARLHLKECPKALSQHCIKYVSEGSTVRDCAAECTEKRESWGTKVFCCTEEGCNGGPVSVSPVGVWATLAMTGASLALAALSGPGRLVD